MGTSVVQALSAHMEKSIFRHLLTKFSQLFFVSGHNYLTEHDIYILNISQTWLTNHTPDQQFAIPGSGMGRLDRQREILLSVVMDYVCSLRTKLILLYVLT